MAERADQGFEVAPTRIGGPTGPGRPRRRRAPIVLVILLAVAIPAVAWIGPRIEWRPEVDLSFLRPTPNPAPSRTPRPTRAPTPALPTPLPSITIGEGPHPTEPFALDVNGVRLVDPTSGSLGPPIGLRVDSDAIFTSEDGGWWCVCFNRIQAPGDETATVSIRRVDPSGRTRFHEPVGEYRSVADPTVQDTYNRFDLEISPDGRTVYLASASRNGDQWRIAIETVDLGSGHVTARTELGSIVIPPLATPTPPPDSGFENYLSGPSMRLSPGGRQMLIWSWLEMYSPDGSEPTTVANGWLLDLDPGADGAISRVTPMAESFATRLRTCYWVGWTTDEELAGTCWPSTPSSPIVSLVLFRPDGTEIESVEIPDATSTWFTEPILDRENRRVLLWKPEAHVLQRIDLDRRTIEDLQVDPNATGAGLPGSGSGSQGQGSAGRPDWATLTSDLRMYFGPQMLPEPHGNRLFALGMLPGDNQRGSFASSGIWVFDADGERLLDHWGALAAYQSIGLSADGRWLLATGAPGANDDGDPADWQASITVHDLTDGRPALQLGRLGTDVQVFQVPP